MLENVVLEFAEMCRISLAASYSKLWKNRKLRAYFLRVNLNQKNICRKKVWCGWWYVCLKVEIWKSKKVYVWYSEQEAHPPRFFSLKTLVNKGISRDFYIPIIICPTFTLCKSESRYIYTYSFTFCLSMDFKIFPFVGVS